MGLLKEGKTLSWEESKQFFDYIREHGVIEFLNSYSEFVHKENPVFLWGDEIEYMVIHLDDVSKKVTLALTAEEILHKLNEEEHQYLELLKNGQHPKPLDALWRPEYGSYMLESTPGQPYEATVSSLLSVEGNMRSRRESASKFLHSGELLLTFTMFPLIGARQDFTRPPSTVYGPIAMSRFTPDSLINSHPRFRALTKNIRERRKRKVCIKAPLFLDTFTDPKVGLTGPWDNISDIKDVANSDCCQSPTQLEVNPDIPVILMDSMAFGMGSCCLQCTLSTRNIEGARRLYDQLVPLCPLVMALSASTPIVRGLLADTDVRWYLIAASVDDRTCEEMKVINKSRYDSVSLYISNVEEARKNSDLNIKFNSSVLKTLLDNGVDEALARHISHLFIRDPLVCFSYAKDVDDSNEMDHFENTQSTNWQTCRFKPPPLHSNIGWRVEFRVLEAQFTEFEAAAFVIFIILLTRVINKENLNFYMPISKVDHNMSKAHLRNAVLTQKFTFKTHWTSKDDHKENVGHTACNGTLAESKTSTEKGYTSNEEELDEYTLDDIFNGTKKNLGLIPRIRHYLDDLEMGTDERQKLEKYLEFISMKASGKLLTTATYMRQFVMNHNDYHKDSVISDQIAYDLVKHVSEIANGTLKPKELFN